MKSTKRNGTIHPLEIDETDFPPLTPKKCVVVPEKRHQAVKALNIKKITGSVYQRPRKGHRLCMLWRTGSQLPVIPEEPELDVIVEHISTHDPQPSNTPQQTPISKATNPAEAFFQQTGGKMIAVPEIDFVEDKSEEIIRLEQAALLKEVEQLKEMLQTQRALQAQEESEYQARVETLQLEISNTETSEKEALCKTPSVQKPAAAAPSTGHPVPPAQGESSQCSDLSGYKTPMPPLSASPRVPSVQGSELPLLPYSFLPSDPGQWNIEDVYEFISSLPWGATSSPSGL
ncbi:Polyhomeotic-like protein 2 [Nibea albiflora]|uniref:Polyhomeotic-like protein 2 n=1 Tax=Nibea albiflora TaxID=240163 RepID=A0ACB7EQ29_NIBAL|nr:Polyhomeotic-like protein 2 [Nibea albiflora]